MSAINHNRAETEREDWTRCGPWKCHPEVLELMGRWLDLKNRDRRGVRGVPVLHRDDAINFLFFHSVAGMRRDIKIMSDQIEREQAREARAVNTQP